MRTIWKCNRSRILGGLSLILIVDLANKLGLLSKSHASIVSFSTGAVQKVSVPQLDQYLKMYAEVCILTRSHSFGSA